MGREPPEAVRGRVRPEQRGLGARIARSCSSWVLGGPEANGAAGEAEA